MAPTRPAEPSPSPDLIDEDIRRVLAEDVGDGDLTAALVPAAATADATVICRQQAVICGRAWFDGVFRHLDPAIHIQWNYADGDTVSADAILCRITGPARGILTGERSALNFLQTLSGTATRARAYADAVAGTHAQVLDTRKTLPGLRQAQKYAVRCGGGRNHRMGLYDGMLIKENHIQACGSVTAAVAAARAAAPAGVMLEVEVENLDMLREALAAGAAHILLDNFDLDALCAAVAENRGRARLESSGNITLETIRAVAQTGVDFISVGALTKDVTAVDLSMRFTSA